jgi:CheY-like chemotaxis protein
MRPQRILLVEDDVDDQAFFIEMMAEVAATATYAIADNGAHAFTVLNKLYPEAPDLIFLDLNMPVMGGLEFLRLIKNNLLFKDIPVVVLTTSRQDSRQCYDLGACLYITKPDTVRGFRAMVTDLLGRDIERDREELRAFYSPTRH